MTNSQAQLEQLFELEKQLHTLLDDELYSQFQQQQVLFSDKINHLLDSQPEAQLIDNLEQLKKLDHAVQSLQMRADDCFKSLKEKSLLMQRNKNKIKAYK
ncbi:hypothetical protein GCM10007916_04830 [Psychromonas marina]|uniref:Flagellar protein FliT n=1 Tax=Psychromonas marina TaxID=88364 RepID=A0ABQ6DXE7_9GAMM|nr:hypothetical protein [Psychromonas marina]GLS89416.1 hypothetical protein GCM10007916_04830 [Psychromonas marina]